MLICGSRCEPFDCCTGAGTGACDELMPSTLATSSGSSPSASPPADAMSIFPTVGSARGAGFAIAWQEDPAGLRPGKGKGPGEGWSGAISNHKTDMWYSFICYDDFTIVDEQLRVPAGQAAAPMPNLRAKRVPHKPGLGRPKALVPFTLPVRVTDNDMVNTHTLKVEPSTDCPTSRTHRGEPDRSASPRSAWMVA